MKDPYQASSGGSGGSGGSNGNSRPSAWQLRY